MNKLKTLSIATCCMVSALLSEAQCMQEGNAIENVVGNARHAANFDIGEAIAMLRSELDQIRQENLDLRDQLNRVQNINTDPGRAKAWINYNGETLSSHNCTITRMHIGVFKIDFTVPFSDSNYSVGGTSGFSNYPTSGKLLKIIPSNYSANSIEIRLNGEGHQGIGTYDPDILNLQFF